MTSATILTFRKPARTEMERYGRQVFEAKTAELVNEQITADWIRAFVAEMEAQRVWDDAVRAFVGERI